MPTTERDETCHSQSPRPKGLWHWCRCSFRWCRIALLAAILGTLILLTWLRLAGLPDFVRRRIIAELADRGVAADFEALRFHWFRGFVAENLRVSWGGAEGPRVNLSEVDLDVAPPPWRARQEIVRGLSIRRGDLVVPIRLTNEPDAELRVDRIAADLRFKPGDTWEVRRLAGHMAGLQVELRAEIRNVAALRRPPPTTAPDPNAQAQRRRVLRSLLDEISKWSASQPLQLDLALHVDGRTPWDTYGDIYLDVPEMRTPHGDLRGLRLSLRTHPVTPESPHPRTTGILELGELQTADGGASGITGRLEITGPPRPALPTHAAWSLHLDHLFVRGLRARDLELQVTNRVLVAPAGIRREDLAATSVETLLDVKSRLIEAAELQGAPIVATQTVAHLEVHHALSATPPRLARLDLTTEQLSGAPGRIGRLDVRAEATPQGHTAAPPPDLGFWAWLWPLHANLQASLQGVEASTVQLQALHTKATWNPPLLVVDHLDAALYGGELHAQAELDVATRLARAQATTTFDLHAADPFLGPKSRENFARYQWTHPPHFEGTAEAVLPPWTARKPDWNTLVKPTVRLQGRFNVNAGSFKGVAFDHATSSISYDGDAWRLPDIRTRRPEGQQEIAVEYFEDTREYRVDAHGHVHPPALKPILGPATGEILDLFQFQDAVGARVSVWGPWTEGTRQSIVGRIHATNFVFRDQRFDRITADVIYTNRTLIGSPVLLSRDAGLLAVDGVGYDFARDFLTLTNAVNTIEPAVVAAAISPSFPARLAPYRFDSPPHVVANGTLHPKQTATAQMSFDIDGGPFHFWKLSTPRIRSRLLWQGTDLTLTNIQAEFYRGTLSGFAAFDLADAADGRYRFQAHARDAHLGDLLREVNPGRDKVAEGSFDLELDIESARTSDLKSWDGHGRASLRDGILWDAPIFGFISPALNAIVPGLGNNRAKSAEANFTVTNSVFHTRDLNIACPPARLFYRGTIDFEQQVDAKVEAQVLSDVLGVGPIFGLLLRPLTKLMEFRVTGTLADVKAEPLYIPKFLLLPLQPVRMLLNIINPATYTGDSKSNRVDDATGPDPVPPLKPD